MKVYLAGGENRAKQVLAKYSSKIPYLLFTYYSVNPVCYELFHTGKVGDLMLDSGAFSFMAKGVAPSESDLEKYTTGYISDINEHKIKYFFELDIDVLVGLPKVEKIRERIIHETGKNPIVVWHSYRGIDYFKQMCKDYEYVAIGSPVWKKDRSIIKQFPKFINTAHKYGAKIHGLGFTNTKYLKHYDFDSVDSSSWISFSIYGGGRYFKFTGSEMVPKRVSDTPLRIAKGKRHAVDLINLHQWVLYSKYMDSYNPKTVI